MWKGATGLPVGFPIIIEKLGDKIMKKVLVVQHIHEEGIKISEKEVEVIMASNINEETLIKESKDCDGILIRTAKLSGEVIRSAKKLKVIGRHGVGIDNIDVKTATEQGVLVVNAQSKLSRDKRDEGLRDIRTCISY